VEQDVSLSAQPAQSDDSHPVTMVNEVPGIQLLRFERPFTDEEHAAYLADAERDMAGVDPAARLVMIIDVNNADRGSSVQRQHQAEWQARHEDYFKRYVIAGIFVARSPLLRGALRAIGWFKPYPYPMEITANIEDALTVASVLLDKEGLPAPNADDVQKLRAIY
jgi:hypothetical protein